jgi:hypothetical protein
MKATQLQIKLFESILMMTAYRDTIKPEITKIYNEVMDYMIPPKYLVDKHTGEKITDYNQLYRIEDNDHIPVFYSEVNKVLIERGFKPQKENCCHLLETEELIRDLNRQFAKACIDNLPTLVLGDKTKEEFYESLYHSMKFYDEFLEINKRYVIGFIDKKKLVNTFK